MTSDTLSGDVTASLADGATVVVEGSTDVTTGTVTATLVHLRDLTKSTTGSGDDSDATRPVHVLGAVAALNTDGTSFTLTVRDGEHLNQSHTSGTLTVQTTTDTKFVDAKTAVTLSAVTLHCVGTPPSRDFLFIGG